MTLPEHFFISASGHLHDTRRPDWADKPLRIWYSSHRMGSSRGYPLSLIKAALRAGEFTDLGGYRLAFITTDGGCLSFDAVRSEFRQVCFSHLHDIRDQWHISDLQIVDNFNDTITCDHTGEILSEED